MVAISDDHSQHRQAWQPLRAAFEAVQHVLHAAVQLLAVRAAVHPPYHTTPQCLDTGASLINQGNISISNHNLKTALLCLQIWLLSAAKQALLSATLHGRPCQKGK